MADPNNLQPHSDEDQTSQPLLVTETSSEQSQPRSRVSRRTMLSMVGTGVAGAALGAGAMGLTAKRQPVVIAPKVEEVIRHNYSPHGKNQPGIITPTPAVTTLISFTLNPAAGKEGLIKLLKMWSLDIVQLMAGQPIPGDVMPEFAQSNVSLGITVGFGPAIFQLPGLAEKMPAGFIEIPAMRHDALQARWSGGDLLVIISADDPTSVAYAEQALINDAETWASVKWIQHGFWRGTDGSGKAVTGRNLFGQLDGSANPKDKALEETLWPEDAPDWFKGGTQLVVRRIEMNLATWNTVTRERHEKVLGRKMSDGAPLSGGHEFSQPDFNAKGPDGQFLIAENAHVRLSHPSLNNGRQMLRRGLNYTHEESSNGTTQRSSGLIFMAFAANLANQFIPVQRNLDNADALNEWTKAIGSAVFVIPPGFPDGSWLGQRLLEK